MSRGIEARYSCGHKGLTLWPNDVEAAIPADTIDAIMRHHECCEHGAFVSRRFLSDEEMYGSDVDQLRTDLDRTLDALEEAEVRGDLVAELRPASERKP